MHAELTFGNGMIMLGSESNRSEYSKYTAMPDELGGREMRSVSLIVSDCDAAYAQAKAAGAEMVFDLEEKGLRRQGFYLPRSRRAISGMLGLTIPGSTSVAKS